LIIIQEGALPPSLHHNGFDFDLFPFPFPQDLENASNRLITADSQPQPRGTMDPTLRQHVLAQFGEHLGAPVGDGDVNCSTTHHPSCGTVLQHAAPIGASAAGKDFAVDQDMVAELGNELSSLVAGATAAPQHTDPSTVAELQVAELQALLLGDVCGSSANESTVQEHAAPSLRRAKEEGPRFNLLEARFGLPGAVTQSNATEKRVAPRATLKRLADPILGTSSVAALSPSRQQAREVARLRDEHLCAANSARKTEGPSARIRRPRQATERQQRGHQKRPTADTDIDPFASAVAAGSSAARRSKSQPRSKRKPAALARTGGRGPAAAQVVRRHRAGLALAANAFLRADASVGGMVERAKREKLTRVVKKQADTEDHAGATGGRRHGWAKRVAEVDGARAAATTTTRARRAPASTLPQPMQKVTKPSTRKKRHEDVTHDAEAELAKLRAIARGRAQQRAREQANVRAKQKFGKQRPVVEKEEKARHRRKRQSSESAPRRHSLVGGAGGNNNSRAAATVTAAAAAAGCGASGSSNSGGDGGGGGFFLTALNETDGDCGATNTKPPREKHNIARAAARGPKHASSGEEGRAKKAALASLTRERKLKSEAARARAQICAVFGEDTRGKIGSRAATDAKENQIDAIQAAAGRAAARLAQMHNRERALLERLNCGV